MGRLHEQKNIMRLLEIFRIVHEKNQKALLLIIGDGGLREKIEKFVIDNHLSNDVILLGRRSDVGKLMCAMDVFVLPSLYDGLGVVMLEAQASGLPCVKSSVVPAPDLTGNVCTIPLEASNETGVKEIENVAGGDRETVREKMQRAGYDIRLEAVKLERFYECRL